MTSCNLVLQHLALLIKIFLCTQPYEILVWVKISWLTFLNTISYTKINSI